jgi:hypothetical protein
MLNNYYIDKYGILHQKEIQPFSKDYGKERNDYGEKSKYLSYLRLGWIISTIKLDKVNSILDVGFGNGDFLRVAQDFATNTFGYDLNYKYLPPGSKPGNLLEKYNIITMFDSLEHFSNLNIIFNFNCDYLVVSIPNCKYPFDDKWLLNWKHLRPNEHLHHMNLISFLGFVSKDYAYMAHSYFEDIIRKDKEQENILTVCLKKKI